MSSHHFVKEGQEPALFIVSDVSFDRVESLLEWAPLILVSERVLDRVLSWGIRLDVVVVEMGRVAEAQKKLAGIQVVRFLMVDSLAQILPEGLKFIQIQGQIDANVFVDDFESIRATVSPFVAEISVIVFDGATRWIPVVNRFEKWVTSGSEFSVLKTHEDQHIEVRGLIERPAGLVAAEDGLVSISVPGLVWLGEPI